MITEPVQRFYPVRPLPVTLANLLLLALLAYTFFEFTRDFISAPVSTVANTPAERYQGNNDRTVDIDTILNAKLFGEPEQVVDQTPVAQLEETRLTLKLTGILSSVPERWARAIIDSDKDQPRPYAIGDELPGNASLREIHPRFVVLVRDGKRERLTLYKDKIAKAPAPSSNHVPRRQVQRSDKPQDSSSHSRRKNNARLRKQLKKASEELSENPDAAVHYFRLQPVHSRSPGQPAQQIKGFRYYPGTKASPLHGLGVRTGDVITHINDAPVKDADNASEMMKELIKEGGGTLTIERQGRWQKITLGK